MKKEDKLFKLNKLMKDDKSLPLEGCLVFGQGSAKAKIVFIGEAPGAKEEELGQPFVGRSGNLLNKALLSMGLLRDDVYITNIVKRRPKANRDPKKAEIEAYQTYLEQELAIIKPLLVVSLGRFPLQHFLPGIKISKAQGKIYKLENYHLLPIYHPAATFRKKAYLEDFNNSFLVLEEFIKNN